MKSSIMFIFDKREENSHFYEKSTTAHQDYYHDYVLHIIYKFKFDTWKHLHNRDQFLRQRQSLVKNLGKIFNDL